MAVTTLAHLTVIIYIATITTSTTVHVVFDAHHIVRCRSYRTIRLLLVLLLLLHKTVHPIAQLVGRIRRYHMQHLRTDSRRRRCRRGQRQRTTGHRTTVRPNTDANAVRIHRGRSARLVTTKARILHHVGRIEELEIELIGSIEIHFGQHFVTIVVLVDGSRTAVQMVWDVVVRMVMLKQAATTSAAIASLARVSRMLQMRHIVVVMQMRPSDLVMIMMMVVVAVVLVPMQQQSDNAGRRRTGSCH